MTDTGGENAPRGVRVAVNVMRARITIVGFNVAIITFQMSSLRNLRIGATELPSLHVWANLSAETALFTGLALSGMALVAFITSSAYDQVGVCDHWILLAGDLFMYLSLAQTLAAFFEPYTLMLQLMVGDFATHAAAAELLHLGIVVAGGVAWAMAAYLGPVVALARSPFGARATGALAVLYVVLLLGIAQLALQARTLEAAGAGQQAPDAYSGLLQELARPLRW